MSNERKRNYRICISHLSALRLFMWTRNDGRTCWPLGGKRRIRLPPKQPIPAALAKRAVDELGVGFGELHILVSSGAARRRPEGIIPHYTTTTYSFACFYQVDANTCEAFVTSPELTFLQLAGSSDFLDLVAAGNALCSAFRFDPSAAGGVVNRSDCGEDPWTTVGRLESFLRNHAGSVGAKRALSALRYVYEGSLSPKESGIAMACGMPYRLGGYALGHVEMNRRISIFTNQDRWGSRTYQVRIPDIVITARGVDGVTRTTGVDYDPWSTHGTRERMLSDALRRNQIATVASLTHITLTTEQVMNYRLFEQSMDSIRRTLNVRKGPRLQAGLSEETKRLKRAQAENRHRKLWEHVVKTSEPFGSDAAWGSRLGR